MENRRLFSFLLTSMAFLWLWTAVIAPKFFPPPKKPVAAKVPVQQAEPKDASAGVIKPAAEPPSELVISEHPQNSVVLGSLSPDSGYALEVHLTSTGAAVESVLLTAPQYRDLNDGNRAAQIIGNNRTDDRSLTTAIPSIDRLLKTTGQTLETANWKLARHDITADKAVAVFEYEAPDGTVRVRKSYTLPRLNLSPDRLAEAWRSNPTFYTLTVSLEITNLTDSPQVCTYEMQGPVGLLLENEEHTSKYRDLQIEFEGGDKPATLAAKTIQDYCDEIEEELGHSATSAELRERLGEDHEWVSAIRYAGVDVQFFAALIAPLDDRPISEKNADKWLEKTYPVLIRRNSAEPGKADVSLRMVSNPLTLQPQGEGSSVAHSYAFFVGPKRRELLDPNPLQASQVLNYGMFGFVARGMHFLLDFFFTMGMPYFLAIVSLTVLVRGCLFPISRKQAISAARMKELQPQITALKEKFGDDREKLARAQMELWRKHKINPIGGCLPLFLQLPIFVGLYTALNSAVDLRLQSFLWIHNLAAPDALFRLPFSLPLGLGSDFSVFPLCTVALFLIQQKLFMPPAQDEQQEMQYKMMNMMTVVMGFMFWHQPAGLCLYFIASSLWSIAERKLLGTGAVVPAGPSVGVRDPSNAPPTRSSGQETPATSATAGKVRGFLQRWMDAAQAAQKKAEQQREKEQRKKKNSDRRK